MFLVIFVVVGFGIGYWLEMTRAGFLVMALTAIGFFAGQILHVLMASNRAELTVLPIVIGLILLTFMLIGALARVVMRRFLVAP
jgi:hypothetical protein